ncbi:MAG: response regulator, partial [Acidobacteria bacterium]|nr:response regulator [Acidobacteriota bacterium]NIQ85658.1 response regulator [Acidobacteriota bacterium]
MSHRILVIDHHPQGLQRVVEPLREAGYEVAVAQTVADGASVFGRFEPQLVFIAARLPRTHGTVLCRELKRTDAG